MQLLSAAASKTETLIEQAVHGSYARCDASKRRAPVGPPGKIFAAAPALRERLPLLRQVNHGKGDIMLIKANALKGYSLKSLDGDIGSASEFFFDDRYWAIRYLVANTASWLTGRKVLISPYSLNGVDKTEKQVSLQLTKKEIEDSPSIDMDEPVSRQYETSYNGYYDLPNYWGGPYMWGSYAHLELDRTRRGSPASEAMGWDPHLRSTHEVIGYHLLAIDGEIGHVDDFIIDDETWAIRYLVVATKNWWPGKKVLISPKWIESVSWDEREVVIGLTRETIKDSPEYTDESLLTRDYETGLHGYYNREGYWVEELSAA
jgi:hypothetical protein